MSIEIFDILNQLDKKQTGFLATTDENDSKEIATFLRFPALRWMSATMTQADHVASLERVNEANIRWWSAKTPKMQAALLASAGLGRAVRRKWVAPIRGGTEDPIFAFVRAVEPDTSAEECTMFLNACSDDDLISLALRSGQYDTQTLTDFKKVLKAWRKKHPQSPPASNVASAKAS